MRVVCMYRVESNRLAARSHWASRPSSRECSCTAWSRYLQPLEARRDIGADVRGAASASTHAPASADNPEVVT